MRGCKPTVAQSFDLWSTLNHSTGCLEWTRPLTPKGYGQLSVNGRPMPAHRFAWTKRRGTIPHGMHVLHRCDNGRCVNVDHLFLGTNLDNILDKQLKGRAVGPGLSGESHPMSKLTLREVDELRHLYSIGNVSQLSLARTYGVTQTTIGQIVRGDSWGEKSRQPRAGKIVKLKRSTVADMFYEHWKADESSGCWLWQLSLNEDGYGHVKCRNKRFSAHRFSYALHHGIIPDGFVVRHKCDNRSCVNPAHLRLGTQAENISDMVARGRQRGAVGEANTTAKLGAHQVIEIRRRLASGMSRIALSKEYGVSAPLISAIATRRLWKHIEVTA